MQLSWGPFGTDERSEGDDGVGAFSSHELSDNSWEEAYDRDGEGGSFVGRAPADLGITIVVVDVPEVLCVEHAWFERMPCGR